MARKTNKTITSNGKEYKYSRIRRKIGMKQNKRGEWVSEYKEFYGASLKDAERKYQEYMKRSSLSGDKPFGELMDQYIHDIFLPDGSYKQSTKTRYANAYYHTFKDCRILGTSIQDITGMDFQKVISNSNIAPSTLHQAFKLLNLFYTYLESNHIATNVTAGLSLPKIEHKRKDQTIEVFSEDELNIFRNNIPKDHRLRLMVILAIDTGARIGEILALTYGDIIDGSIRINKSLSEIDPIRNNQNEDAQTTVSVTETKTPTSIRSIPLGESTIKEINRHKRWHHAEMLKNGYRTDYIFTTSTGSLYYKSTLRTAFKRLCKQLNIVPRGFHVFRHTFGTRLASAGVPIQTVSSLMGHSSVQVTSQYYINVGTSEKKSAIEKLHCS